MPLQKQTVPVQLSSLAQKAPKQTGVTGSLDVLQNMIALKGDQTSGLQGRSGGIEFWPRPGITAVSRTADSGSITSGVRMATLANALLLQTGSALYRKATDEWHRVNGEMPIIGLQTTSIVSNSVLATSADVGYVAGYTVSAATQTSGTGYVHVLVTDAFGATVVSTNLDNGFIVKSEIGRAHV